jgi:hypothetical protein
MVENSFHLQDGPLKLDQRVPEEGLIRLDGAKFRPEHSELEKFKRAERSVRSESLPRQLAPTAYNLGHSDGVRHLNNPCGTFLDC